MNVMADKLKMLGYKELKECGISICAKGSKVVLVPQNGTNIEIENENGHNINIFEVMKLRNNANIIKVSSIRGIMHVQHGKKSIDYNSEVYLYVRNGLAFSSSHCSVIGDYKIDFGQEMYVDRTKVVEVKLTKRGETQSKKAYLPIKDNIISCLFGQSGFSFDSEYEIGRTIDIGIVTSDKKDKHIVYVGKQAICMETKVIASCDTLGDMSFLESETTLYTIVPYTFEPEAAVDMGTGKKFEVEQVGCGILKLKGQEKIEVTEMNVEYYTDTYVQTKILELT